MEKQKLNAEPRTIGKGNAGRLRRTGKIPAILYGKIEKPINLFVDEKELKKTTSGKWGMNAVFDLTLSDGTTHLSVISDYQADTFSRRFTHVDFHAVLPTDKVEVEVPLKMVGKAIGVKEGGVLEQLKHTIHLRALPESIPVSLDVDVSSLNLGENIHANDIKIPDGVEFLHKTNFTIAAVVSPTKVEAAVPVVTAVEGEAGVAADATVPATAEGEKVAGAKEGEAKAKDATAPADVSKDKKDKGKAKAEAK